MTDAARRATRRRRLTVAAFLSPWLVGFAAFIAYPLGASLYYSFTHYDLLTPPRFTGLENYRYLVHGDALLWTSVRNTLWFTVVDVPLQVGLALALALLLQTARRGRGFFRAVTFLPSVIPPAAAALAFAFLLDPGVGPVNAVLRVAHLPQPLWFHDPRFAKPGLVLLSLWTVGPSVIVFLAALNNVAPELYEVAVLEGASAWQRFRRITLPMISPVVLFSMVITTIGTLQYFTEALVASHATSPRTAGVGAPLNATLFYAIWLYRQAFTNLDMGYASAMAWVLLLVTVALIAVMIRVARRWVYVGATPG